MRGSLLLFVPAFVAFLLFAVGCGETMAEQRSETTAPEPAASLSIASALSSSDAVPITSAPAINSIGHDSGAFKGFRNLDPRRPTVAAVRMGAVSVNGSLPPEIIQRIVRHKIAKLRECYNAAALGQPTLSGRATTTFTIGPDGAVKDTKTTGDLANTEALACIQKELAALKYPAPESGSVKVSYPIVFAPPKYAFKIGDKNSVDATEADIMKALEAAGYKVTGAASTSQPTAQLSRFKAEKAGITFSLTLDPAAKLPLEDYETLKLAALMLEDGSWVLFVESSDVAASRALIDAIHKKLGG